MEFSEARGLMGKWTSILGMELSEASLRVKSELLKSTRASASIRDIATVLTPQSGGSSLADPRLTSAFAEFFSKFRVAETTRRMLTTTKSVIAPDTSFIRAQITSADVIHS
jgi:heme/copper-type cytochrome/quinol oxidase subunit 2